MTTFIILPGTAIAVSRDGGTFEPKVAQRVLRFAEPVETSETTMTFAKEASRVQIARALVVIVRSDGQHGEFQRGA
jgi:hypothetical protein